MAASLAEELITLLEPLAAQQGFELVTVEVVGGHRRHVVRVFLDRQSGIDIEAIADANSWIAEALDGVSRLAGPYTLEVSSPGLDRVLRTRDHFARFMGQRITVNTRRPMEGRSRFTGELAGLDGDEIVLITDDGKHRVRLDAIEHARLKADLHEGGERNGTAR